MEILIYLNVLYIVGKSVIKKIETLIWLGLLTMYKL
jgi:hypothetical protein